MAEGSDCPTGKCQYVTREAAWAIAMGIKRKHGEGWRTIRPYLCAFCSCWHLGNRRNQNSRARGRR